MEGLYKQFAFRIRSITTSYKRFLFDIVDWSHKLVIIKGAQKIGKSYLALQYAKLNCSKNGDYLYVNANDFYFLSNSLQDTARKFREQGGRHLIIDDVHKYAGWEEELADVLYKYDDLSIVLIGSITYNWQQNEKINALAAEYELPGLSFREYVNFSTGLTLGKRFIDEIFNDYANISTELSKLFDPMMLFQSYLSYGYYPFFMENRLNSQVLVNETVSYTIEHDITFVKKVDFGGVIRLKRLFTMLVSSENDSPNTSALGDTLGSSRRTILEYMEYLAQARLVVNFRDNQNKEGQYTKPQQVYVANSNILGAMFPDKNNLLYEMKCFFFSQLLYVTEIEQGSADDLIIDSKYKVKLQTDILADKSLFGDFDGYSVVKHIEVGYRNKIPLWLFGFVY